MRRSALVPAALAGAAVLVLGSGSADAAAKQTAKDLTVKKADVGHGFKRETAPKLVKGPLKGFPGCTRITYVPKGSTEAYQDFFHEVSLSADQTDEVYEYLQLDTVLTPSDATAASIVKAWKKADKACPDVVETKTGNGYPANEELQIHVGSAPSIQHVTSGFTETTTKSGTYNPHGVDVPVSGQIQTFVLQRHRAVTFVTLYRAHATYTPQGDIVSLTYVLDPGVQSLAKTFAKLQLKALGKQTAA